MVRLLGQLSGVQRASGELIAEKDTFVFTEDGTSVLNCLKRKLAEINSPILGMFQKHRKIIYNSKGIFVIILVNIK